MSFTRVPFRPAPDWLLVRATDSGAARVATSEEGAGVSLDYDAPYRHKEGDEDVQGIEELQAASAARTAAQQPNVDQDEVELAEKFELPGADLSDESLTVRVEPQQVDEFTCTGCFLVRHRTQLVTTEPMLCRDCA
jgi:hypothetical protein